MLCCVVLCSSLKSTPSFPHPPPGVLDDSIRSPVTTTKTIILSYLCILITSDNLCRNWLLNRMWHNSHYTETDKHIESIEIHFFIHLVFQKSKDKLPILPSSRCSVQTVQMCDPPVFHYSVTNADSLFNLIHVFVLGTSKRKSKI